MVVNPVWKWTVSLRIYSLPFVAIPYFSGILSAVILEGARLNVKPSVIGFFALVLGHIAGNLLSDIYDFRKGIDRQPDRFSGALVRKWITPGEAMRVSIFLYGMAILTGIYLVTQTGVLLVPFVVLGSLLSIMYSVGNQYAAKYNVTGEWFIFLGFGLAIPLFGFVLNTGHLSITPLLISLPAAFLLAAVKHANNWMAALTPGTPEINTSAYRMGSRRARIYFYIMIIIPYFLIGCLSLGGKVFEWPVPDTIGLVYFSLPFLTVLISRARKTKHINDANRIFGLDSLTASLFILFTSLCCLSLLMG